MNDYIRYSYKIDNINYYKKIDFMYIIIEQSISDNLLCIWTKEITWWFNLS